ncbi:MAG: amidohydrolase family protein [Rhodospirillaceae bacterium]
MTPMPQTGRHILRNAHVIDPANGVDAVTDVVIADGKVAAVGAQAPDPAAAETDLAGCWLSPGWVDIHVHAYGTLGFADPDSIGVYQGVTSFVEAGGPGIDTLDEFFAMMDGLTTDLYVGPFIRPMGLIGLHFIEGKVRSLGNVPIARWMDLVQERRDSLRYLKANAVGDYGTGALKVAKGLSEILDLPLYMHVGEFQQQRPKHLLAYDAYRLAEEGDIVTHLYHNNLGRVLDENGKVFPVVRDAEARGVLFDLGFGGYNFAWDVAENAFDQGLLPHTISSDLQQFNVVRPTKSLANVMTVCLRLGMTVGQVIERVTANAARAIRMTDRAGALTPGMPADITVFRLEKGEFELNDCATAVRKADTAFVPVMTFKNGVRYDADLARGQDERNWFLQVAEDEVPPAAAALSPAQRDFLGALGTALEGVEWKMTAAEFLEIDDAIRLQEAFRRVQAAAGLPLADALRAAYAAFLTSPFPMQIGLLLLRLDRRFAIGRLAEVANQRPLAA